MTGLLSIFLIVSSAAVLSSASVATLALDGSYGTTYTTSCGSYSYFQVYMTEPCKDLNIITSVSAGEPDIYVSKSSLPTTSSLSWAAYEFGDYEVSISHWDAESSPGWYYISVFADCSVKDTAAVYQIKATLTTSDDADMYLHPQQAINQMTHANQYAFYKFCLPSCADVIITLDNWLDPTVYPKNYSYPEMILSRTQIYPEAEDYSYKLADTVRRYITVNHSDPAGRDHHGYMTGSYYVSVFGWCTPDQNVIYWESDGPCSYAANVPFNITITTIAHPSAVCAPANITYPTEPNYPLLESGVEYTTLTVNCNAYTWYKIAVDGPCYNLNVATQTLSDPSNTASELAIGKYPNTKPTFDNLQWTSYNWGVNNITISAWDPNFVGGTNCGKHKSSLCYYYIGVYGYCVNTTQMDMPIFLQATLARAHAIYDVAQTGQQVMAGDTNRYQFCVASKVDARAYLAQFTDACTCPNTYTNLEMTVSRYSSSATTDDKVWRLESGATNQYIDLLTTDTDTRPGPYYLSVNGYCAVSAECSDKCSCAPCSNLNNSVYSLLVQDKTDFTTNPITAGSCSTYETGHSGSCSSSSTCSNTSSGLSDGAKAGIAIAVIIVFIGIAVGVFLFFRGRNSHLRGGNAGAGSAHGAGGFYGQQLGGRKTDEEDGGGDLEISRMKGIATL